MTSNSSGMATLLFPLLLGVLSSPAEGGEIKGQVLLKGPVPAAAMISIERKNGDHSTEGCGSTQPSQQLLVDSGGGISNVVVWLEFPPDQQPSGKAPGVVLDQKECRFFPHVVVVPPEGRLVFRNSDPIRHNIRIFPEGNPRMLMHRWQPAGSKEILWRFTQPGRYIVRCGIHPWMYAWAVSVEHPYYAVTDSSGHFTIPEAPAGTHRLHLWHESLGSLDLSVEVNVEGASLPPILFARGNEE